MKELQLNRSSLDEMFETINENFREIQSKVDDIEVSVRNVERNVTNVTNIITEGDVINRVDVTVDNLSSDNPSCRAYISKDGEDTVIHFSFTGIKGRDGEAGTDGTRGSIIYLGADTTSDETANRLTDMTGSPEFRIGDLFLNSKTFELKECTRAGAPTSVKFRSVGFLGKASDEGSTEPAPPVEIPDPFTGTSSQLVLGDGSVIGIADFITRYIESIRRGLNWFRGGKNQVVLGTGEYLTIGELITSNADVIRNSIGVVTQQKAGLVPRLPADPEA